MSSIRNQLYGKVVDDEQEPYIQRIQLTLWLFALAGFFCIICYSIYAAFHLNPSRATGWRHVGEFLGAFPGVVGTLALVSFAAFCSGGIFGFLFGVPKSVTSDVPSPSTANERSDWRDVEIAAWYRSNTNLEEMSDWLTKIIIGAGLVQLHDLVSSFEALVDDMAAGLSVIPFAKIVVGSNIVGFLILGFFTVYLLTRLYLAAAFSALEELLRRTRLRERRLQSLVNLELRDLNGLELASLEHIISSSKEGGYILPTSFRRESDEHEALRALRDRGLVEVVEGGSFRPGKTIRLTPIAEVPEIRRKLEMQLGIKRPN